MARGEDPPATLTTRATVATRTATSRTTVTIAVRCERRIVGDAVMVLISFSSPVARFSPEIDTVRLRGHGAHQEPALRSDEQGPYLLK